MPPSKIKFPISKQLTLPLRLLSQTRRQRRKGLKAAALFLLMALFYLIASNPLHWGQDCQPAGFNVVGSELIVKNEADEVLWKHDFGAPLDKGPYLEEQQHNPRVLFDDLTGDGKQEVLIGLCEWMNDQLNGRIYCFSASGRVMWIAKPGRKIRFGENDYEDAFNITQLRVVKNRRGERFVAVSAHHYSFFPSFAAVYNMDGALVGQYWSAGAISDIAVYDFDGDGDDEIIAGGFRNEDGRAFLAVLEIDNMWGLSPQDSSGHYSSRELPPGTERYYLRLPASPFSVKNPWRDFTQDIVCLQDYLALSLCNAAIADAEGIPKNWGLVTYHYDYRLQMKEWHIADLAAERIVKRLGRQMTPAEIAALDRTDYWDGEKWVQTPTESSRYKKIHERTRHAS